MNQVTSVFVNGTATLEKLVEILSLFLSVTFTKLDFPDGLLYRSFIHGVDIEVDVFGNHGLEDDCGICFTSYDYEVRMESIAHDNDQIKLLEDRHELSWKIVDELSAELGCNSIVVDGLQRLVSRNM